MRVGPNGKPLDLIDWLLPPPLAQVPHDPTAVATYLDTLQPHQRIPVIDSVFRLVRLKHLESYFCLDTLCCPIFSYLLPTGPFLC